MVFHDVPRDDHEEENKEDYDVPNNDDIDEGKILLWKYTVNFNFFFWLQLWEIYLNKWTNYIHN